MSIAIKNGIGAALVTTLLVGCAAIDSEVSGQGADAIIGGKVETGFAAAGYLVAKITSGPHAGELVRSVCGATLIAEDAVVTTGACVEEQMTLDRTIVGVGFGDVKTGPTIDVLGTAQEWLHPKFMHTRPSEDPNDPPRYWQDARYSIAVVGLKQRVMGIAPVSLTSSALAANTPATVVGHGTAAAAPWEPIASWLDDPAAHEPVRKSAKVNIAVARNTITAYPFVDANGQGSGGMCFGDFGSPLFLDDGTLAGLFTGFSRDVTDAWWFDDVDPCRADAGAEYVSVQFSDLRAFVDTRLHAIHATH